MKDAKAIFNAVDYTYNLVKGKEGILEAQYGLRSVRCIETGPMKHQAPATFHGLQRKSGRFSTTLKERTRNCNFSD